MNIFYKLKSYKYKIHFSELKDFLNLKKKKKIK